MTKVWKEHNTQKIQVMHSRLMKISHLRNLRERHTKRSHCGAAESWSEPPHSKVIMTFSKNLKSEDRFVKKKFGGIKQKIGSTYIKKKLRTIAKRSVKCLHKNVAYCLLCSSKQCREICLQNENKPPLHIALRCFLLALYLCIHVSRTILIDKN